MIIGPRYRRRGMLDRMLFPKRAEVARMLAAPPLPPRRAPGGGVIEALRRSDRGLSIVAEVKLRSPSAGPLSQALSPAERALVYARAGAAMVSVRCDGLFFGGSFAHLAACRDALDAAFGAARPRLLARELVVHPIQIGRAVDAGADAVLLVARIVTPRELEVLARAARDASLEPLFEVATEEELEAALDASARVVGVNARDLNTLKLDPERAARVMSRVPPNVTAVQLWGVSSPKDVRRIASGRADAVLVSEALMRVDDPAPLLAAMVEGARK